MYNYLRMLGGVLLVAALFLKPFKAHGDDSALRLAAHFHDPESIVVFVVALLVGIAAAVSTFFMKQVNDRLELSLTLLSLAGIVGFIWRFGDAGGGVVKISYAGLALIGGCLLIAYGAHGRYKHREHE